MSNIASSKKTLTFLFNQHDGLYFWNHKSGSFMAQGLINPTLATWKGGKFKINCLTDTEDVARAEASDQPVSISVTIQCVKKDGSLGGYLSCRKMCLVTQSSLAEYRSKITKHETFEMFHVALDNSYIFQAYNGLFLHVNDTFHTVAFKTCSEREGGLPKKGRWDLLLEEESRRFGKHSAAWSIPTQIMLSPITLLRAAMSPGASNLGTGV
jgi:hypothetical protein